jgi:hypothetical protein
MLETVPAKIMPSTSAGKGDWLATAKVCLCVMPPLVHSALPVPLLNVYSELQLLVGVVARSAMVDYLGAEDAHDAYVTFAKLRKIAPASMKVFRKSMERLGFVAKRFDKGIRYLGISLLS